MVAVCTHDQSSQGDTMSVIRFLALAAILCGILTGTEAAALGSKNTMLSQTVDPITCVYTITEAGGSTSSSTACDSLAPATLDTVEPRRGKPLLGGTLTTVDLLNFRVWVGGEWFTSGISNSLVINGGFWTLDLATLSRPLAVGDYSIVLEERTTSDFLLRSIYTEVLSIPRVIIVRTDTADGSGTTSEYVSSDSYGNNTTVFGAGDINTTPYDGQTPDSQLLDETRGLRLYTSDSAQNQSQVRSIITTLFGLAIVAAVGYIGYLSVSSIFNAKR